MNIYRKLNVKQEYEFPKPQKFKTGIKNRGDSL